MHACSGLSSAHGTARIRRMFSRCHALSCLWIQALFLCFCAASRAAITDGEVCAICGTPFTEGYYSIEDAVTLDKKHICKTCEQFPDCFVCGVPADAKAVGFIELPDHRVLCARDARTAVINEDDGLRACRDVKDSLDRLFSRFTSFPETNISVRMVDRVHLIELFKLAGNDYHCPNIWGITETKTNHNRVSYDISLMSGLPLSWFQATCAHEYGHTWMGEHVGSPRREELNRDAEEGFCELLAYLLMESRNDQAQQKLILRNGYTRGQIDLFLAAERSYGINEILDWMQSGTDNRLSSAEPGRILRVAQAKPMRTGTLNLIAMPSAAQNIPDTLRLKAVFWDRKHPLALINDHTFEPNEEARVHVGTSNVLVRCMSIDSDAVQLRIAGSDRNEILRLKAK
jgi:hypothetical protein